MNGRASRRIRRAVWAVIHSTGTTDSFNKVHKKLKREYRANPYHKRKGIGYVVLPHKGQERRWIDHMKF